MKIPTKKLCTLGLALLLGLSLCAGALAATEGGVTVSPLSSSPVVAGYQVYDQSENPKASIHKGENVIIKVYLVDFAAGTAPTNVSKILDDFQGDATLEPEGGGAQYTITFNVQYSGNGNALRFMVGDTNAQSYTQLEVAISECVPTAEATFSPTTVPGPKVRISRSDIMEEIKANDDFLVTLYFTNESHVTIEQAVASISPTDSLLLMENATTFPLGNIPAGQTVYFTVRLKAMEQISSQAQGLSAEIAFNYFDGTAVSQGTASDKITIPAKSNAPDNEVKPDGPVPNVILKSFDFGESQLAAGSEFQLKLEFYNTSSRFKVENMILTIEPGEGLAIVNSSNTFYYASLGKEESAVESIPMQVLASVAAGVQEVNLTFKYEYLDNDKRSTVTQSQKISVYVYQPDRFELSSPSLPMEIYAGNEVNISIPYVNKGKSPVSNVQAEIVGDIYALSSVQNIGNLEAGKSGNINFIVTPFEAGEQSFTVQVNYEDASGKAQAKEIPVTLTVNEMMSYDDFFDPGEDIFAEEPVSGGFPTWGYFAIGGGALLTALAVVLILKKRKKARRAKHYSWDEDRSV